ncbi:MAG: DNA internalization-related competence protein ComEC/Rec2, partial [Nitrospira sp.]|nr:DNA internalization-related competence protein ComEC/Rec2 [Nitrospira sp.]
MLPSLTAAFLLGLLGGSQLPFFPLFLFALFIGAALGFRIIERAGYLDTHRTQLLYISLLLGVVYWSVTTPPPFPHPPSSVFQNGMSATVTGRVVMPVQYGVGRQTILLETDTLTMTSKRIRVVWRGADLTLHQGDRIMFQGTFHRPRGFLNPAGFDYAAYIERQGIDLVSTVSGPHAITRIEKPLTGRWSFWSQIDQWRATIRQAAVHTLRQPALGIFLGMIIGERGYLEQDMQEWFMITGTVHLLSISGSHLGLVAVVCFWTVKRAILRLPHSFVLAVSRRITPSKVAILFTWPAVALYALLAGAELATMRSLIMITLGMVAVWLGHERHLGHAMAAALLIIVLHDPRALFDISFQLSFLSVLAILGMISKIRSGETEESDLHRNLQYRVKAHVLGALLLSGAVTLVTLPLVAFYFNQVPWMGIMTNLVAVPFTGFVLVPLGLLVSLWTIVADNDLLIMAQGLEQLFNWMVSGLRWCAAIPGGEWYVAAPSIPTMILFYAGVLLASIHVVPRRFRVMGAGTIVVLLGWWFIAPGLQGDGDHWRVTFLDVGQGDSAVIELPDGRTVLIDGGTRHERFDMGQRVVAPFLWNRGIHHIDFVIGTHQQLDHVGGLVWILRHMSIGQFFGGGIARPEQFAQDLQSALRIGGISERVAVRGQDLLHSSACQLKILNPSEDITGFDVSRLQSGTSLNNHSIVSRLQCGVHSILFAADIEIDGLSRLTTDDRRPVTLLKVPH